MAKSRRLVGGIALFLVAPLVGGAIVGCGAPDGGDDGAEDATTQNRGALTTSLFQPFVAYPTGSSPEAVAIGDLDGDGRNDIALLTSFNLDAANDYMVHVFLQNTDGTLKPRVKYPVGRSGGSMEIGDVNGDGRADVVVGVEGADQIGVLLQNASGTLDAMIAYPTANSCQVKIGDFNGDGRMDVAGINSGAGGDGVDVFLQTEAGALEAPVTYHVSHGGFDELEAGDVDGDGRTDLVVMSGQLNSLPNLNVLLQTSDGVLGTPTSYSVGSGIVTSAVALGDTNGDGRSDIVVSYGGNKPSSFIARFLQNSQGTLELAASYPSLDIPSTIVLADVDGDGRKDVVIGHGGFGRLGVFRQYPSGDFVSEELYPVSSASNYEPQGLAVGDINGDGRPDAVLADQNSGLVVLRHVPETSLALAVTAPAGGPYYVGAPLTVRWTTGDSVALTSFDVSMSSNGTTYTPIAGCTGLPATARECPWTPSGPAFPATRVRVTARDAGGQTAFAETSFNLIAASITVTAPTVTQFVGVGRATTIAWTHNLPPSDTVRVELSRDGGGSYETLEAAAPSSNVTSTRGSFVWNVTGPTTSTARVRVTSNGPLPASGTTSFAITTTPTLTVLSPGGGATYYTNAFSAVWSSNAGNVGIVRVELSRDGGTTFETLADAVPNEGRFIGPIPGPSAASARVRVTLTLDGSGSVTATGSSFTLVQPELAVTSPVAGATLFPGTPTTITWSSNLPASLTTRVELSRNGGSTYEILPGAVSNGGSFAWNVTGPVTSAAQVRLTVTGPGSTVATSGTFAIATPSLTVTGPASGAAFYAGAPLAITWTTNLPTSAPARVEISRDGGSTYEVLATNAPNTGSFAALATGPDAGSVLARVTITSPVTVTSTSGAFAIVTPALTVTGPAAGTLYAGTTAAITWTTNLPASSPVRVELSRDGGGTYETLAAAAPNTGSFAWVVTGPDATAVLARVTLADPVAMSSAGGAFAIVTPALTVTGPAAGTLAYAGTPVTITWTHNFADVDPVSIELSRDGGATFQVLDAAAANSGSFVWTASGPDTGEARVRVTSLGALAASGLGPAFPIVTPSLAVTSPTAGASWAIGTARTISWSSSNLPAGTTARVELSRDAGASWTTLAAAAPAGGSLPWTATAPATSAAIVRVSANGGVPLAATSGLFTIGNPALSVTSPAAGASWTIGTAQTIAWNTNLLPTATVKIQLSRNGGGTYTTLASTAPNTGSFAWTATGAASTNAIVRITANGVAATGLSGTFSLVAAGVTVTSPNTPVVWTIGSAHAITWNHNLGAGARFMIEVSRSGTWSVVTASVPGGGVTSGSYGWTVTGPKTTNAKIRVTWVDGTTVKDTSDVTFQIK